MQYVCLFLLSVLISQAALADITGAARYEYIRGPEEELANRLILKSKLSMNLEYFGFYAEGFGEFESNDDQKFNRRSPSRGYLQEAYLEYKREYFFARLGRQALRWSESWTVPSLDVWSGRRYNRLYFDPLQEQLTHSTGLSLSYAKEDVSIDLVGVWEMAETIYPVPLPSSSPPTGASVGGRIKWNMAGFGFSVQSAKLVDKYVDGLAVNYAFDHFVPKLELGHIRDDKSPTKETHQRYLSTLGVDVFWGNWIILPQISVFEAITATGAKETQTSYYLTTQWNPDRHDVQFQFYRNAKTEDTFGSASYGYNFTDWLTMSAFVQNYEGSQGLYHFYEEMTGGWTFGVRAEFTGNLVF